MKGWKFGDLVSICCVIGPHGGDNAVQIGVNRIHDRSTVRKDPSDSLPTIKEGWMVHFTSKNPNRLRHYWRLNSRKLILFQSDTDHSIFCKINLDKVFSVDAGVQFPSPHAFQMRTNDLVFYAGDKPGSSTAEDWAAKIKKGLVPVGRPDGYDARGKIYAALEDVHAYYQLYPDDVLGAGQFGIVYDATHRPTGRKVRLKNTNPSRSHISVPCVYRVTKHGPVPARSYKRSFWA